MYHCDYCRKDISQLVRIRCSECDDFDLCLECFATGAHVAPHQPTHDYRVVNNVKTPLWAEDWGADEELLLLEALEMFGMGNWSDVSRHTHRAPMRAPTRRASSRSPSRWCRTVMRLLSTAMVALPPLLLLQVADHVGTKNKTQCETHYADVYCTNPQLLPVRTTDSAPGKAIGVCVYAQKALATRATGTLFADLCPSIGVDAI